MYSNRFDRRQIRFINEVIFLTKGTASSHTKMDKKDGHKKTKDTSFGGCYRLTSLRGKPTQVRKRGCFDRIRNIFGKQNSFKTYLEKKKKYPYVKFLKNY